MTESDAWQGATIGQGMRRLLGVILLSIATVVSGSPGGAEPTADLTGDWEGVLTVEGGGLPLVLHLAEEQGRLRATLDSPAQGAFGLGVTEVEVEDGHLYFRVPSVGGSFRGELRAERFEIWGTWRQGALALPLTFRRSEVAADASGGRPQEPQPPFPYLLEGLRFASAAEGITLAGTLSLPRAAGPHPALVLVSGSGPQDRDSTLFGHKPFRVVADHFTRRGYAVLRFDDRGVGGSSGTFETATTYDFVQDVIGATRALEVHPRIDGRRLTLLGHSEGGVTAILAANRGAVARCLVLVSAPALPYSEFVVDQVRAQSVLAGDASRTTRQKVRAQRRIVDAALSAGAAPANIMAAVELELTRLGVPPAQARRQAMPFGSPWMAKFLRLDPRRELEAVAVPVLALWGELDSQVDAARNAAALRDALGEKPHQTVILDGLNHLMQPATTGALQEYGAIETTFSTVALTRIETWLAGQDGR